MITASRSLTIALILVSAEAFAAKPLAPYRGQLANTSTVAQFDHFACGEKLPAAPFSLGGNRVRGSELRAPIKPVDLSFVGVSNGRFDETLTSLELDANSGEVLIHTFLNGVEGTGTEDFQINQSWGLIASEKSDIVVPKGTLIIEKGAVLIKKSTGEAVDAEVDTFENPAKLLYAWYLSRRSQFSSGSDPIDLRIEDDLVIINMSSEATGDPARFCGLNSTLYAVFAR